MISHDKVYAVVGATTDVNKYGYKVLKDLVDNGFHAVPVNPKGGRILGMEVYPDLGSVPEGVDVVIFVVPPKVTEKVIEDVRALGVRHVWMQPGSGSDKAIDYCKNHGIECVHDACIMMRK